MVTASVLKVLKGQIVMNITVSIIKRLHLGNIIKYICT